MSAIEAIGKRIRQRLGLAPRRTAPRSFAQKFGKTGPFGTDLPLRERFRVRRCATRVWISVLSALLVISLVLGVSYAWRVKRVTAVDGALYSADQLLERCGIQQGDVMLGFDQEDVEARLMEAYPLLGSVHLTRRLNGTVVLEAREVQDAYYTFHNGNYYLLSADRFKVLAVLADTQLFEKLDLIYLGLPEEARLRYHQLLTYAWLPYPPVGAEDQVVTYELETEAAVKEFAYVQEVLARVLECPFADRLTGVELGDRYDLWLLLDRRIKILLGDARDIQIKLSQAAQVLAQSAGTDSGTLPVLVDVSVPDRATYREMADLTLPSWAKN